MIKILTYEEWCKKEHRESEENVNEFITGAAIGGAALASGVGYGVNKAADAVSKRIKAMRDKKKNANQSPQSQSAQIQK